MGSIFEAYSAQSKIDHDQGNTYIKVEVGLQYQYWISWMARTSGLR